MICLCLIWWYAQCQPAIDRFIERHIVAEHPKGPWGYRPDDPKDWNVDWENWKK